MSAACSFFFCHPVMSLAVYSICVWNMTCIFLHTYYWGAFPQSLYSSSNHSVWSHCRLIISCCKCKSISCFAVYVVLCLYQQCHPRKPQGISLYTESEWKTIAQLIGRHFFCHWKSKDVEDLALFPGLPWFCSGVVISIQYMEAEEWRNMFFAALPLPRCCIIYWMQTEEQKQRRTPEQA